MPSQRPTIGTEALETPFLLVDLDSLELNLDRMARYAAEHHLSLRPHTKTHKSPRIAAEQLRRGASGVTCATILEAEVMAEVCDDILLAYPPVGGPKLERLLSLPPSVELTVALDSAQVASQLANAAAESGRAVGVYIELDVGLRRVGLSAVEDVVNLARLVSQSAPLIYRGICFYPGHLRSPAERRGEGQARLQRDLRVTLEALDRAGLHPPVVSGGSTPTFNTSHEIEGLTEIRPGTYVFNDRTTCQLGACRWEDCALSLTATVVSTAVPDQAVVDAGSKALGREPPEPPGDGFAAMWDRPEVSVTRLSEEHGILDLRHTDWRPQVGEQVRLVPNHACVAVQLHEVIYGARAGRVETSWPVLARGRRPLQRPLEV